MIRPASRITLAALALIASIQLALPVGARQSQPPQPQTWQESQNFKSGPTPFEPLMTFWYELDAMSDLDREFTLVTIAKDPVSSPQDAIRRSSSPAPWSPAIFRRSSTM